MAIQKDDIESVLFLLSINVDVNSRVQNELQTTPLHLAAATGNETLVRSIILAGARVRYNNIDQYLQLKNRIKAHFCTLGKRPRHNEEDSIAYS